MVMRCTVFAVTVVMNSSLNVYFGLPVEVAILALQASMFSSRSALTVAMHSCHPYDQTPEQSHYSLTSRCSQHTSLLCATTSSCCNNYFCLCCCLFNDAVGSPKCA